jgi:hypothetical protein
MGDLDLKGKAKTALRAIQQEKVPQRDGSLDRPPKASKAPANKRHMNHNGLVAAIDAKEACP